MKFSLSGRRGFTVVELIVVVMAVAILATITYVAYGASRERAALASVQSDAHGVQTGMEDMRNWKNAYPVLPSGTVFSGADSTRGIFTQSDGVLVTYVEGSADYYCVDIVSRAFPAMKYFYDTRNESKTLLMGDCAGGEYDPSKIAPGLPIAWRTFTLGATQYCGVARDSKLYCAGVYGTGVGSSVYTVYTQAALVYSGGLLGGKRVSSVSAGGNHTCAVAEGDVWCWGISGSALGNGSTTNQAGPVKVSEGVLPTGKATIVAASQLENGSYHTCALAEAKAYCWGYNGLGQLGNGTKTESSVPVAVDTTGVLAGVDLVGIYTNPGRTIAVSSDNRVFLWGSGNSLPAVVNTANVPSDESIKKVAMGGSTNYMVTESGKLYVWGGNSYGALGNGTTSGSIAIPTQLEGVLQAKKVVDVAATKYSACALTSEGTIYCWGRNHEGQLGISGTTDVSAPTLTANGDMEGVRPVAITGGGYSVNGQAFCALSREGAVYCWGNGRAYSSKVSIPASDVPLLVDTGVFR